MSLMIAADPSDQEEIVLFFDFDSDGMDAQAFGHAIIAFDELYRAINSVINPGVHVEIEFVRSDHGSIKAVLKSIKKDAATLLKSPFALIVFPFLLNVISGWVSSDSVTVIVNDSSYVVQHGKEKIVLPREAAAKVKQVEQSATVRQSVRKFFAVVESDPSVTDVDFRAATLPDVPVLPIKRNQFPILRDLPEIVPDELPKERKQSHFRQQVVILKAVLEKSKSKWQFLWNGVRISADILHEDFFHKLANHEYEFGQGDILVVDLIADQVLNSVVGAYENKGFHIVKVYSHAKGPQQASFLPVP